jgi:AcrR family transcriptional regulator
MSRRASAVAQTRRRIIHATRELHAARAGVGVGTVYRHFPTLDELIPACGEISMQIIALPDPQGAPSLFDGIEAPAERIERLVREVFAIYERGAPQLRAIRNEPDVHPGVAESGEQLEASLGALVDAAVGPSDITPGDRAVVRAMLDLGTWQALRDQGLGPAEAVAAVSRMLAAVAQWSCSASSGSERSGDGPIASRRARA